MLTDEQRRAFCEESEKAEMCDDCKRHVVDYAEHNAVCDAVRYGLLSDDCEDMLPEEAEGWFAANRFLIAARKKTHDAELFVARARCTCCDKRNAFDLDQRVYFNSFVNSKEAFLEGFQQRYKFRMPKLA